MLMILRGSFRRRALAAGSGMEAPSPEAGVVLVLSAPCFHLWNLDENENGRS
jgi:hypothetical protein